jgi:predicted AAA+ superfamily ATPase
MIEIIEKFKEIQTLLMADVPLKFVRTIHDRIDWSSRLVGLVGPRGVGKTTIVLQHIVQNKKKSDEILYLSADSIILGNASLFEIAKEFHLKLGGRLLCIDEVHRCKDWSTEIKSIYDSFPKLKILFTGSSQINILKGRADLARRAEIYTVPGLSFREYLELKHGYKCESLSLAELIKASPEFSKHLAKDPKILQKFREYLARGYYPYSADVKDKSRYYKRILSSIDKAIFEDISLASNLQTSNLIAFKEILTFLSSITPGEVNVHKIAKNIGKKDDTIKHFLQILGDTSLLRFLPNSLSGHAKLKAAQKIYFDNTNMLEAFCYYSGKTPELGLVRETFVIEQLQSAELIPLYSKDGDLTVGDFTFEIGGKGKGIDQLKGNKKGFVLSDDILLGFDSKIPLHLLGFLY